MSALLLTAWLLVDASSCPALVGSAANPALHLQRQPDGALLLRLREDAPLSAQERERGLPVVITHDGPVLRTSAASGGARDARWHTLSSIGGNLRSGGLIPLEWLRQGLVVRDEGLAPRTALRNVAPPDPWASRAFLCLEVSRQGLHQLSHQWLADELGHSLASLPDPRRWNLVHNGRVEPVLAEGCEDGSFDEGDRLIFWAELTKPPVEELGPDTRQDPWCAREIYFLALGDGPGARLAQETGEIVETNPDRYVSPLSFPDTLLVEEENHFSRLTYVQEEPAPDHMFWTTGIYGGTLRQVTFNAPGLDPYNTLPLSLRVCLRGLGAPSEEGEPDVYQRMRLYVNNQGGSALEVGADGSWRNQDLRIATFGPEVFPDHSAFFAGENTLYLAGVDEAPAGPYSSAMLNWIELAYQRHYLAHEGQLLFSADPDLDGAVVNFEVAGFPGGDIHLFKVGRSHLRNAIVRQLGSSYRLRFQDEFSAGTRYVAAADAALLNPAAARAVEARHLADITDGAQALVVVADSLMRAGAEDILRPMLEERFSAGGALVLSDRWIYDEFSHGRNRPHAIRDLVARAWSTWSTAPRWLLMVGDGILMPRSTQPGREPVLPLMYEQVYKWGAASSDDWYVRDLSGGTLPTLVSRWPAATPEDLQNMVEKVLAYEQAPAEAWQNSLLFTSGARAQDEGVFMEGTEDLIRLRVPERFFLRRINAGEEGGAYIGSRTELINLLNQGQLIANYAGHGGGAVWEDNALFSSDDVSLLDNGQRLAFITNATCFIGSLDYQGALGRALLDSGPVGAIGVLGSTGLGFRDTGLELVADFIELACANPQLAVAEVLREAKDRLWLRHVPGREGSEEALRAEAVVVMNVILGLPWQRLRRPSEGQVAVANPLVRAGEMVQVSGEGALPGGTGRMEIYSSRARPAQTGADFVNGVTTVRPVADGQGRWTAQVESPASLAGGATGSVRVWMPDNTAQGHSAVSWFQNPDSLSQAILWRAAILPDPPRPELSLDVEIFVSGPNPPDSLAALLSAQLRDGSLEDLRLPMRAQTGDPQRLRGSHSVGPWPDSTLVGLRFVQFAAQQVDTTTTSWYWLEAARPRISWNALAQRDELGRVVLSLENGGDGDAPPLAVLVKGRDGSLLASLSASPLARDSTSRLPITLPDRPLDDSLFVSAGWDPRLGGPWPVTLAVAATPAILRAGVLQSPAAGLQVGLPLAMEERVVALAPLHVGGATASQPSLELISSAYSMDWLDGQAPGQVQGSLLLTGLDSARAAGTGLVVWHREAGLFLANPLGDVTSPAGDTLRLDFLLSAGDGFAAGRFQDLEAPSLRLEVEGQVFADGGYVAPGGTLSWRVEDPSGVDPRPHAVAVHVRGRLLEPHEFSLRSDSEGRGLVVQAQLDEDLPRGEPFVASLACRDAAGNEASLSTTLRLGQVLALRHAGNYPNPFQRETRFVFSLTGVADRVAIDIYTVSGRRIRRLEAQGPLINYAELEWDGRDRAGDVVANGVYFWRLTAEGPEGRVEYTGKTARLK